MEMVPVTNPPTAAPGRRSTPATLYPPVTEKLAKNGSPGASPGAARPPVCAKSTSALNAANATSRFEWRTRLRRRLTLLSRVMSCLRLRVGTIDVEEDMWTPGFADVERPAGNGRGLWRSL